LIDRILIADDEFLIRQLLEETARRRGIDTSAAASGEEAIELLGNEEFQMAFVDLKMGKASGMDVLRFAVEKCPKTLFVIMTAYGTVENRHRSHQVGCLRLRHKAFSRTRWTSSSRRRALAPDGREQQVPPQELGVGAPLRAGVQGRPNPLIGSDVK
jgi:DNA-binding NtrC family response regulator